MVDGTCTGLSACGYLIHVRVVGHSCHLDMDGHLHTAGNMAGTSGAAACLGTCTLQLTIRRRQPVPQADRHRPALAPTELAVLRRMFRRSSRLNKRLEPIQRMSALEIHSRPGHVAEAKRETMVERDRAMTR